MYTTRKDALAAGAKRYSTGKPCLNGHIAERKAVNGACVTCAYEKYKRWAATPRGQIVKLTATRTWKSAHQERQRETHLAWCARNPVRVRFLRLRSAANKRGLEFDLDESDLAYPEVCPALGIPLDYSIKGGGGPRFNSPSVDRIDTTKGYIKGNVVVVSQLANAVKNQATPEQVLAVAQYYLNLQKTPTQKE